MHLLLSAEHTSWTATTTQGYEELDSIDISVTISLYNYNQYILSCLESVIAAIKIDFTLNIEVLIINDASTDASIDTVKTVMEENQDLAFILIDKTRNSGLPDTRNLGIRLSRSQAIFILDADNTIAPFCLSLLHHHLVSSKASSVYCRIARFNGETNELIDSVSNQILSLEKLLESNYIDAMALFTKTALFEVGLYDTDMKHGWEDYDLWLALALGNHSVHYYPETLAYYRVHEDSMLTKLTDHALSISRYLYKKYQPMLPAIMPGSVLFGFPSNLVTET